MNRKASVLTRAAFGLETHLVYVECHLSGGLPGTTIVGLADGAVREARDRVKSAIRNSGFNYPTSHITLNLAPSHLSKSGSGFDLPIAVALLAASGQIPQQALEGTEFVGELGLFGELRRASNLLASAVASQAAGHRLFLPLANQQEVALVGAQQFWPAANLLSVVELLSARQAPPQPVVADDPPVLAPVSTNSFDQVIGQHQGKRALVIAAAGGHHMLMVGPPGTGKTLLAESLVDLLPDLEREQMLEVATIYSAFGSERRHYARPPLRRPHHSASNAAMGGGGHLPTPGEVTLAHRGILFLDELPHFKPTALDLLREPIETGEIAVVRARYRAVFPSRFQLIAAMNPCPAGRSCKEHTCRCTTSQVQRYQSRISGPLLDRIDLHVPVPELNQELMFAAGGKEPENNRHTPLAELREQVAMAQQIQVQRQGCLNAYLNGSALAQRMAEASLSSAFLTRVSEHFELSMRSYHKVWRIALTLADLEQATKTGRSSATAPMQERYFVEALGYRAMQWGIEPP
jgi:magnesium chelatase family protein